MTSASTLRLSLGAALVLALAACANPAGIAPQAQLREAASVGVPPATAATAPAVETAWWRAYGDPALDQLVDQALAGSPSLGLAQARLARALAVVEVADAALLPQVGLGVDLTRQRYTETGAVPAPLAGTVREIGLLQLSSSWELDFFGKNRAALDAALGGVRAAAADAQAARALLAQQIVRGWLQLARAQDQLAVAERTLAQRGEQLALVKDRLDAGLDTHLELRQAEGGLPEARQQIEALREQIQLSRHALAALAAQPPESLQGAAPSLARLQAPGLPAVLPADLLGRRADVQAARWRVEAATRDVDAARAQFYPNISLTGFAGLSSIGLSNLLQAGSLQWGIGPALRLPLFDAGRLRANLRGKAADVDAAVESYNGAIVGAVREVADQLVSVRSVTLQQQEQRAAQEAAEGAYAIAKQRYGAGLGNYLQVLTAESNVLAQRRQQVELAARALDVQAQLAHALGGGVTVDPAPATPLAQNTAR
ncbi:efflux transporter outer membrane subunit [Pseudorhodoferax sp.]|uniref:efflux transporter outer membrane subunit n=1 Tax=Pseudorhodoferax sp. TaxID=1993553 RepID=UPI002DD65E91|nr:efflux transporter outer membrane subunit [Pseudorhodoferax sp.]